MSVWLLIKGFLTGLLVSAPLGPVGVMCIQRTLNRGIKSGVRAGFAAATADMVYAIIAVLGLGFIINFIKQEQHWIQLVGSLLILVFAIKIFYTDPALEVRKSRLKKNKPFEEFISIFFVTLSNPGVFFGFLAVFAWLNIVSEEASITSAIVLVGAIFIGAMTWWYSLCAIINKFRQKIRLKNIWWLNKIMGIVVFVLGLVVLAGLFIKTWS